MNVLYCQALWKKAGDENTPEPWVFGVQSNIMPDFERQTLCIVLRRSAQKYVDTLWQYRRGFLCRKIVNPPGVIHFVGRQFELSRSVEKELWDNVASNDPSLVHFSEY